MNMSNDDNTVLLNEEDEEDMDDMEENKIQPREIINDSDEYEENELELDDEQNDYPPNDVPEELTDNIKNMKYSLYEETVLSPELGTQLAQDPGLLTVYLSHLNRIYQLAIRAINNTSGSMEEELTTFPKNTQNIIKKTIMWIYNFFKTNQIPDTIPVADYIDRNLKENQFVQYGGLIKDE